jgi:hypothetical protein
MEKRAIFQRHLYADHRMVVAIDWLLEAKTDSEKERRASELMHGAILAKIPAWQRGWLSVR